MAWDPRFTATANVDFPIAALSTDAENAPRQMNRAAVQHLPADAAMLENLGLPLTSDRVRESLRLLNPMPSLHRVRMEANLRRISPPEDRTAVAL